MSLWSSIIAKLKEVIRKMIGSKTIEDTLHIAPVISMEMEKYLAQIPTDQKAKATKILEINPDHEIFKVLQKVYDKNKDMINQYADLLYQQALLIEGFPIEDPVDFSNKICQLMQQASQM